MAQAPPPHPPTSHTNTTSSVAGSMGHSLLPPFPSEGRLDWAPGCGGVQICCPSPCLDRWLSGLLLAKGRTIRGQLSNTFLTFAHVLSLWPEHVPWPSHLSRRGGACPRPLGAEASTPVLHAPPCATQSVAGRDTGRAGSSGHHVRH